MSRSEMALVARRTAEAGELLHGIREAAGTLQARLTKLRGMATPEPLDEAKVKILEALACVNRAELLVNLPGECPATVPRSGAVWLAAGAVGGRGTGEF
ncbi:MAG TPA: hypothetical protein DIT13_19660 [Verrucomicrobiales bacterium]|nr:hypothetical protein [Verrucomicrobiales bacterium]HRJ09297.1 hypothetical protein [Prosthecobacter sp.]HRK15594.1 hypothetical protein [Prosthecobacter sp.]